MPVALQLASVQATRDDSAGGAIVAATVAEELEMVLTCDRDGRLALWRYPSAADAAAPSPRAPMARLASAQAPAGAAPVGLCCAPKLRLFFAAFNLPGGDGAVRAFLPAARDGGGMAELALLPRIDRVTSACFVAAGQELAVASPNFLRLYSVRASRPLESGGARGQTLVVRTPLRLEVALEQAPSADGGQAGSVVVSSLCVDPARGLLLGVIKRGVSGWDATTGELVFRTADFTSGKVRRADPLSLSFFTTTTTTTTTTSSLP